jgi:glycosyltransferase involved in cell wall biosynthesis
MKVIHLISGLFFGGGQKVVLDLLSQPAASIEECLVLLGSQPGSAMENPPHFSISYDGDYSRLSTLISAARKLRRLLISEKATILHTHGLDADLIGGLSLLGTKVRQISHLHITPPKERKDSARSFARRQLFQWLCWINRTQFIAVSDAVRQEMAEYYHLPLMRIRTIHNGVSTNHYSGKTETTRNRADVGFVIGSAGRLAPMKGFSFLIEAVSILHSRGIPIQLKIAGTGSQLDELQKLATSKGMETAVEFVGKIDDMQTFYQSVDAFVLASVSTEGLPLVVLEAMCAGLPVIATNVGGAKEAIRDGIDGKIVEPRNSAQLADAIATLSQSPDLRRQMGAAASRRIEEEFSLSRVKNQICSLYQELSAA